MDKMAKLMFTKLDELQNHEDFTIVLLSAQKSLLYEENIVDYLKKCCSLEAFNDYVDTVQSEHKILLILTNFFDDLSTFHQFRQIHAIYILNSSSQPIQIDKQTYSKLVDIFTDESVLIEQLRQDILLTYISDFPIDISILEDMKNQQSLTNLDNTALMFLWNQAFIHYLVNSPLLPMDMNKLKEKMLRQCRLEYATNKAQLITIDDFERNFIYDDAVKWYTKPSFVYRLVNKAFRTRNINLICKFRYFIIFLHDQLAKLNKIQRKENYPVLYRAQKMEKNELKNLKSNVGNLIATSTIMSATRSRNVAEVYVTPNETNVMFEIHIPNGAIDTCFPFADISQFSAIPDDDETLFFAGSVFRIESVVEDDDSLKTVKITLVNQTISLTKQFVDLLEMDLPGLIDEQLTHTSYWARFFTKTDDFNLMKNYYMFLTGEKWSFEMILTGRIGIDFHYLFRNLGKYEKFIEYYKQLLLDRNFINQQKFIVLNILIGCNYLYLGEHYDAFTHYGLAFSLLDENHRLTGELYHHIGDVWNATRAFKNALSCYCESLRILTNCCVKDYNIARLYRKMSNVYRNEENDLVAAKYYEEKAEELDKSFRQPSELNYDNLLEKYQDQLNNGVDLQPADRANVLYSMGLCLIKKRDYVKALKKLFQAKELYKSHLSSSDHIEKNFIKVFDSIAWIYLRLNDYFNALLIWKRSIDLRRSFLSN
ncbi:unnamed protein product [Adineta ricciae]|uniref:NAD(P)(+)--arginine ADP-ribosyltransferase n=1 Tax=Adineta ricciae TaxID=249248 RepID=A0A815QVP1_ADIRI|nr:unnamed protein product [Adineta ricciae]